MPQSTNNLNLNTSSLILNGSQSFVSPKETDNRGQPKINRLSNPIGFQSKKSLQGTSSIPNLEQANSGPGAMTVSISKGGGFFPSLRHKYVRDSSNT